MLKFEVGQVWVLNESCLGLIVWADERAVSIAYRQLDTGERRIRDYPVRGIDFSKLRLIGKFDKDEKYIACVHDQHAAGPATCKRCSEYYPYAEADMSKPFTCYACRT